jgi:hypothetical protein
VKYIYDEERKLRDSISKLILFAEEIDDIDKLTYIIYYDEKGKLRKETSWNNWRDKEIENDKFKNIPTSGFVLNKKVGIILLVGIADNHIVECMIIDVLNSRLLLKIYYTYYKTLIQY